LITSKSSVEVEKALNLINDWRANHLHPLRIMKNNALRLLELNSITPLLVSQRLKRLQSIIYKLDLNESMGLGGMQRYWRLSYCIKRCKRFTKIEKSSKNSIYLNID